MPSLRTPLYDAHVAAGGAMTEFNGWEMPLRYAGIVPEHLTVRHGVGLFDVSHMGKFVISGTTAWRFLSRLSANNLPSRPVRARYTHLLDEEGRILDDVIVTCTARDRFFVVSNAGPRERVLAWLQKHASGEDIRDVTADYLCLALQGPKAARVLQLLTAVDLESVHSFRGVFSELLLSERLGTRRLPVPPETQGWDSLDASSDGESSDVCLITRTGYTGEDGFELFPPKRIGAAVWKALLAAGAEAGIVRAGLGARDTLRLEKGYLLSGMDYDGGQTPLETSSEWLVKWDHEFIGRSALLRQRGTGGYDRLVGLLALDRGIPRHGCTVVQRDRLVGIVTSGTSSPSLKAGIALAYVRSDLAVEGTELAILVRDRPLPARIEKLPFV